ncbi:GD16653 [Drosophila simulans]|uniref:GD16653 n=1 Tax=Drosophila simulans TaxID=7240 RepID=B4R474_DROSI|nr:GD16653 [Drosophila simulans]
MSSSNRCRQRISPTTQSPIHQTTEPPTNVAETQNHRKTSRPKKPPFTYTELIEYALEDKGELTVSGIYQWIS